VGPNDIKRIVTKSGHRITIVDKPGKNAIVVATPKHLKISMVENSDETGDAMLTLHSDGDILLNAPKGRIHARGKAVSKEVGMPSMLAGSSKAMQTASQATSSKLITPTSPSQIPGITTISAPKDLGCGSFSWTIWWDIPNQSNKNGWIIQELTAVFDAKKPDGSESFKKTYHYWEAWPIGKGKKVTQFQDEHELPPYDDDYFSSPRPGSKGTIAYTGKSKFFEGDLPDDFKANNPSTIAGDLRSTTRKPAFWDGSGIDHNITANWNCTSSSPTSSVSGKAGSQTVTGTK
jgi:hypothetical protein